MTAYNKLASALILCFAAQSSYALTFNAAQIESTQGQLLYVEIPYANASNNAAIKAGLADSDDLIRMDASQQDLSGLNFFVRRTGASSGVIVITSSQPITNKNINLIVKVQDADGAHLQQIQKNLGGNNSAKALTAKASPIKASTQEQVLVPKQIVSEKDIALNLPESRHYTTTVAPANHPPTPSNLLAISVAAPPKLTTATPNNQTSITTKPTTTTATPVKPAITPAAPAKPVPTMTAASAKPVTTTAAMGSPTQPIQKHSQPQATPTTAQTSAETKKQTPAVHRTPAKPAPVATTKETAKNSNYVVQRQDSLWSIAARISEQTHRPIGEVMKHIKALNEHAFVGGNINRLRAGTNLNLSNAPLPPHTANTTKTTKPASAGKYATKYRIDQAEMRLVTANTDTSSSKMGGNSHNAQKTAPELSLKVMTTRKKTVTLQKNVVQLDLALQQKDHQIQLLNARLAQLQQQLQQQQKANKPSH
ncbi:FimV/HubP-related protein [Acinetobacter sp. ANC 4640]